jgi:hypothetical protein
MRHKPRISTHGRLAIAVLALCAVGTGVAFILDRGAGLRLLAGFCVGFALAHASGYSAYRRGVGRGRRPLAKNLMGYIRWLAEAFRK